MNLTKNYDLLSNVIDGEGGGSTGGNSGGSNAGNGGGSTGGNGGGNTNEGGHTRESDNRGGHNDRG